MAWYKNQMNGWPEPANFMHHPEISDADGMKYSVSGYSESHRSARYEAKTEQTFQFRSPLVMNNYEHSSPRKDMYKEHGMDGKPLLVPWGLARDQPEKDDGFSPNFRHNTLRAQDADGFSPKYHHEALRAQDKGSPRKDFYKGNSPPTRDHEIGKYNYFKNNDDDYESDDEECVKNTKEGSKKNFFKDEKYKGNGHGHGQTQPRKHTYYDNSYDDLDLEKEKGKPHAPKYTSNKYTAPSLNYPKQETYYEKAPTYYNEKHKGNGNDDYTPPYTVPTTIIPRKETYYDTSNNRPMMMPNPPPIRTRMDRGRDAEFYNEDKNSPKYNSPHYNSPSRKDHQGFGEMIDSSEARRRYGKVLPRDVAYVAEDYTGVIDSKEAARRYKGVLLTN